MAKRPETKSPQQRARESRGQQQQQDKTITYVAGGLAILVIAFIIWQLVAANSGNGSNGEQLLGACTGTGAEFGDGSRPLADLAPVERNNIYPTAPETVIDTDNCYEAVVTTAKGDIRLRLFEQVAPKTVNNFVFLANQGFYDGVTFHRVMENFMAQGGDPTGTGTGGPGYTFEDEINPDYVFDRRGLLAMANSGVNTKASQFFITFVPTDW